MDTNTAISTLQSLLQTVQSNRIGFQAQEDALTLAISQLQGTLKTQLDELTPEQVTELSPAVQPNN